MRLLPIGLLLLFVFAILSSPLQAKYYEKVSVQVFDQQYRPIEGAQVWAEHQLNSVKGNIKTKPVLSGPDGLANFSFVNYEEIAASTEYSYTLYVKYGDTVETQSQIATNDSSTRIYTQLFDSYLLYVYVMDQDKKPLQAYVSAGDMTKHADFSGLSTFKLPPGNYMVKAVFGDGIRNIDLELGGDQSIDVTLPIYSLKVHVADEFGNPLPASVDVSGQVFETDPQGYAKFENLTSENPEVIVLYGAKVRKFLAALSKQEEVDVVFDLNRPKIQELHARLFKDGMAVISLFAEDPGYAASGIERVSVSYEVDGVEDNPPAYTIGYNTYEAKIPAYPPGTLVTYSVKVWDRDGNVVMGKGTYVVPHSDIQINATQGGGGILPEKIGIEMIIIGVVAIAILISGVFHYLRSRGDSESKPPPVIKPPSSV